MSHLSILPTVLRDAVRLATSLEQLGLEPQQGGSLAGFGGEKQAVLLQVALPGGESLGWQRQPDGVLALVGDLQRLSRSTSMQRWISRITRCYATLTALEEASRLWPAAGVELSR